MYLQASIANEKDGPSQLEIPSSTGSTKSSADAEPNTAPQDLGDKRGILGQGHINDTETRSSSLSNDDILRPEELSNTRPQVRLSNDVVGFIGNGVDELGNRDLLSNFPEFSQLGRQFWKERLEADSGVEGVQDPGMVRVKLIRGNRSAIGGMARFGDCPAPQRSCSLGCGM